MDSNDTNSEADNEVPEIDEDAVRKDDGQMAIIILVCAVVLVVAIAVYLIKSRKVFGGTDKSWKQSHFTPPAERAAFIEAKGKLDPVGSVADLDELKKLLMRRAIQTIPILLSLQNEGSSIERLYKRGMLTDDMHFRVKELKAFVDQEFQDVQFEAEELVEGWGQHIWPQAMQFHTMIQKQTEGKQDDAKSDEDKKKNKKSKKAQSGKKSPSDAAVGSAGVANTEAQQIPAVASAAGNTSPTKQAQKAAAPVIDPAAAKAEEAERMAQLLLEEEEKEREKSGARNNNSSNSASGKKSKGKK